MEESERMEMVRQIQKSFYQSTASTAISNDDNTSSDEEGNVGAESGPKLLSGHGGIMTNLPLWRVGWVEVPGRANILNVHEGHYTHMFETIVRRHEQELEHGHSDHPTPMYFGHLHLPGGTKSSRTGERRFALKSWRDEVADKEGFDMLDRSAVLGCLMRITDYRRLQDGRLILFVQALERFVVNKVVRDFPYAVANVQLLPDVEELGDAIHDENFGRLARDRAVQRALHHYHDYEFESTQLPLPTNTEYMQTSAIAGAAMAKLLPFAQYDVDSQFTLDDEHASKSPEATSSEPMEGFAGGSPHLQDELERCGILQAVIMPDSASDADGIEKLIWLELEELTRHTKFILPREIKCLLPPEMDYLEFAEPPSSSRKPEDDSTSCTLSSDYPAARRQTRLSFSVPAIWETPGQASAMRQALLQFTSTTARLYIVLQQLKEMNRKCDDTTTSIGEFE